MLSDLFLSSPTGMAGAGLPNASGVDVVVVRSARRRRLAIHVCPLGRVEVRAPLRIDARDITRFLDQHRDWVLRKLADAAANPPWTPQWREGGHWYWRGETILLRSGGPRGGRLAGGVLWLSVAAVQDAAHWQRATFRWHRQAAQELLQARMTELFAAHCIEHRLRAIELRWMRATWGTCHARRAVVDGGRDVKIRLNPWLAALPAALCDAVLLHELAHVEHMNHGIGFYRRLAHLNPGWRADDVTLQQWARLLFPVAAR